MLQKADPAGDKRATGVGSRALSCADFGSQTAAEPTLVSATWHASRALDLGVAAKYG